MRANKFKIIFDAGHGGKDPGAVVGDTKESVITLNTVNEMALIVRERTLPWEVILLREKDDYVSPDGRRRMCMQIMPAAFVSIHCNAAASAKANGFEVIYREQPQYNLGIMIQDSVLEQVPLKKRGLKHDVADLGRKLAVLTTPGVASVIVEMGFLTSPVDQPMIQDKTRMASAIVTGIERWAEAFKISQELVG